MDSMHRLIGLQHVQDKQHTKKRNPIIGKEIASETSVSEEDDDE